MTRLSAAARQSQARHPPHGKTQGEPERSRTGTGRTRPLAQRRLDFMQTAGIEPCKLAMDAQRPIQSVISQRPGIEQRQIGQRGGTFGCGCRSRLKPLHTLLDAPHPGTQPFEQ